MSQLKKAATGTDLACFSDKGFGSDANTRSAVAMLLAIHVGELA